jgi:hypothetical protein
MVVDCCTPVFALMATTVIWETPAGVGTGGGVLLLLHPSMKAAEPRLSRMSGSRSEILSRTLRRRRRRNRENGSNDANVRTTVDPSE